MNVLPSNIKKAFKLSNLSILPSALTLKAKTVALDQCTPAIEAEESLSADKLVSLWTRFTMPSILFPQNLILSKLAPLKKAKIEQYHQLDPSNLSACLLILMSTARVQLIIVKKKSNSYLLCPNSSFKSTK